MERLTRYFSDWAHGAEGVSDKGLTGAYCRGKFEATAIVDRLAAIEDILGDTYDLDRLRELVEADRDGRCVVLPCKVGDRAWVIRTLLDGKGTKVVAPFGEIKQVSINSHGTFLVGDYCHTIDAEKIGDKIFLSEEAAEQALKERGENG